MHILESLHLWPPPMENTHPLRIRQIDASKAIDSVFFIFMFSVKKKVQFQFLFIIKTWVEVNCYNKFLKKGVKVYKGTEAQRR